jgi:hypothetical protein
MTILTTKLNRNARNATVLAKMYKGRPEAVQYTNWTQVENKVNQLQAQGVDCEVFNTGVVKYVRINQ